MDTSKQSVDEAIRQLKSVATRPITEDDLWMFLLSGMGIRKFFKGDMISLNGGDSCMEVFDKKLKECFGLQFTKVKE